MSEIQRTYTLDEVATLLNTVVAGIRAGDSSDDTVYPLKEVARRTGWSLVTLERDCVAGLIEHTGRGRSRGLTSRQLAKLITEHRRGAGSAEQAVDAHEHARQATLRGAAKRGGVRTRAA